MKMKFIDAKEAANILGLNPRGIGRGNFERLGITVHDGPIGARGVPRMLLNEPEVLAAKERVSVEISQKQERLKAIGEKTRFVATVGAIDVMKDLQTQMDRIESNQERLIAMWESKGPSH